MSAFTVMRVMREKLGLAQWELAERVGVHQSEISRAESQRVQIRNWDRVAIELGVPDPADLLKDWDSYRDEIRGDERVG